MSWQTQRWPICLTQKPELGWRQNAPHIAVGRGGPRDEGEVAVYRVKQWCLYLFTGRLQTLLDSIPYPVEAGCLLVVPPGVQQEYHFSAGPGRYYFAHFRLPPSSAAPSSIPAMVATGTDFASYDRQFREAMAFSASQPLRAEVRIWNMLLDLVNHRSQDEAPLVNPTIERALQIIVSRLSQPLSLVGMARELGVSQRHLSRLFRHECGKAFSDYIRDCRMAKAECLLTLSDLQIKTIAAEVGIPDPQLFNKTVRRCLGKSPCRIRQDHDHPAAVAKVPVRRQPKSAS